MADIRLEVWKDRRDEWRWSLFADGVKVAVSPASYADPVAARDAAPSTVVDVIRLDEPATDSSSS